LEIEYPTEISRAWIILNNLVKYKFIDELYCENKFSEYREYVKQLKQKSILTYFLG